MKVLGFIGGELGDWSVFWLLTVIGACFVWLSEFIENWLLWLGRNVLKLPPPFPLRAVQLNGVGRSEELGWVLAILPIKFLDEEDLVALGGLVLVHETITGGIMGTGDDKSFKVSIDGFKYHIGSDDIRHAFGLGEPVGEEDEELSEWPTVHSEFPSKKEMEEGLRVAWKIKGPYLRCKNLSIALCLFHMIAHRNIIPQLGNKNALVGTALPYSRFISQLLIGMGYVIRTNKEANERNEVINSQYWEKSIKHMVPSESEGESEKGAEDSGTEAVPAAAKRAARPSASRPTDTSMPDVSISVYTGLVLHDFASMYTYIESRFASRVGVSTISWLSDVSECTWRDYNWTGTEQEFQYFNGLVMQREKEIALKKIVQLDKEVDAKQKFWLEIQGLMNKLKMIKPMGSEDDKGLELKMIEMNRELIEKEEEISDCQLMYQSLVIQNRQINDELHEARKELISMYFAIIDEEDEKLKSLKDEYGIEVYESVTKAVMELYQNSASGGFPMPVLWNFKEGEKGHIKGGY
ncbi:hypothetical protein GIB67_036941 [Kingdonia uniflora]|uniref:Factor of DNA methylation 1-5/IDN2 domain-containing protein n=1 Tax=Kingdonia uniflora TaxID=39325 RepID=A0A7J7NW03_9MAGN|nr:hypothetical protein GIB67_036941 [Kingdonia uniflora]